VNWRLSTYSLSLFHIHVCLSCHIYSVLLVCHYSCIYVSSASWQSVNNILKQNVSEPNARKHNVLSICNVVTCYIYSYSGFHMLLSCDVYWTLFLLSMLCALCIWSSWCHCIPKPHNLLPHSNPDWFYLSGTRLSWKKGHSTGVVAM